jgi:hypothetical protein
MASLAMTWNGPEPDDVIGTEDPRLTFEDFLESAGPRLLAAARLVTSQDADGDLLAGDLLAGDLLAANLLAGVLERARRRWWWLTWGGREPERPVLRMLVRASRRRDLPDLEQLAQRVAAAAGRAGEAGARSAADLLAAMDQKRARHARRRLVACGVAGVLVLAAAAWPVTSALRPAPHHRGPHLAVHASIVSGLGAVPSQFGPPVSRAPGTVLRECADANNGDLSKHWRAQSVRAGPVWFIYASSRGGWPVSRRLARGRLAAQGAVIAIRAGQRAVVRVTGPARTRFRFLPGFGNSDVYSPRSGLPGLTLGGCPSLFTMFWQGYISTASCVPLTVQALPHGRLVHATLSGRPCRSR